MNENGKKGAFACASNIRFEQGLTKREHFSVIALQGMLSNSSLVMAIKTNQVIETLCEVSVTLSDELLKQLEK